MESTDTPALNPTAPSGPPDVLPVVPPLENGDMMDRFEFERRWDAMPHLKFAELINGIVYMNSALRYRYHAKPHSLLDYWATHYAIWTPGVEFGNNASVRLDETNEPQPDSLLFLPRELGGDAVITSDDYIEGTPDLIAEVAASSASRDMHQKLEAYRANGVREYLVWRVLDRKFDWFVLEGGTYSELSPGGDGILRSRVFPGLWLDPAVLIEKHGTKLLDALLRGLESPEHAAFVEKLKAAAIKPDQPT
jgi:Uma2 family endonuclease